MIALRKTVFIKNAAVLTVSGLILRFIGIVFKVWLAGSIGAEGMGVHQMIFSVYVLASTFAAAGICTAVTRLCADELALGGKSGTVYIFKRCCAAVLVISAVSLLILLFGSNLIASLVIGRKESAAAIRICSLSLPFMGLCSCFRGYFIARRRASPGAFGQIFEQTVRIGVTVAALKLVGSKGGSASLAAIFLGDTVSEALACLLLFIIYIFDVKKLENKGRALPPYRVMKAVKHIALPITAGRYLNSVLRTAENIMVPKFLAKNPLCSSDALSLFGMIKGMALPILFFPSTLINSISTLLIPEMSEAAARGRRGIVRGAAEKTVTLTLAVGLMCGSIFFTCGDKIGALLYKSDGVGYLLCALSPIVPLMYLDGVCDGMLKGLDCQRFTFWTALTDSALRLVLIPLILPVFGVRGFIGIMYFSNFFTCALNGLKLIKVSNAELDTFKTVFLPLFLALTSALLCKTLTSLIPSPSTLFYVIAVCTGTLTLYTVLMFSSKCITADDIRDLL